MVKIYMGLPTTGTVADTQAHALRRIEQKYAGKVTLVYPEKCVRRIFHDAAREAIVQEFLASDCDVLWFLDSDVTPPENILDYVTEHLDKWMAAGSCYPLFMGRKPGEEPAILFTAYHNSGPNGGLNLVKNIPHEGTALIDGLATGCMFLKREVFALLERPYFEFKYDPITREPVVGEDLGFCMKLKEKGIPFFTDYALVCKHYKLVDLLDINNYAIDMGNAMVEQYARHAQAAASDAVRMAYREGYARGREEQAKPKSGIVLLK